MPGLCLACGVECLACAWPVLDFAGFRGAVGAAAPGGVTPPPDLPAKKCQGPWGQVAGGGGGVSSVSAQKKNH